MGDVRRLIVFDLDGTLIDSRADLAGAANALIEERGGDRLPEDAIARMVGEGAGVLVARALDAAGLPKDDASVPRFLELYDARLLATTGPYPGIIDALAAVQPIGPIAVLTNKPLAPTLRLLDALHLAPFIATTIGGDGSFPRKPDPASLVHLLEHFAAAPQDTVMVGDSWIDCETARNAGTRLCVARYGFGYAVRPQTDPRAGESYVDAPAELPARIRALLTTSAPRP